MRYLWCLTIVLLCLCSTSIPALSETVTIWQFGSFDGSSSELTSADSLPSTVNVYVDSSGVGSGFPEMHSPPDDDFNPDNCNIINISFSIEPGNYTLLIGQMFTNQPETVTVTLDGSEVGTFTTLSMNTTHELNISIASSGSHTLTFQEFYGNNGYAFDAVALVMEVTEITANPMNVDLLDPGDIGYFSVQGGIPPYSITLYNTLITEVEMGSGGETVYVKGTGPGTTTITVEDSAGDSVTVAVSVSITDSQSTMCDYNPLTSEIVIPEVVITGDTSGQSYEVKGNVMNFLELYGLLVNAALIPEDLEENIFIFITNITPND